MAGQTKNIKTPELMWQYFDSYRTEIKNNPIQIVEQKKGNTSIRLTVDSEGSVDIKPPSDLVYLPAQRPLTMMGFENWLDDNEIITDVTDYFENKDNRYDDYIRVCSRIRRTIKQDQIEGGMCGIYNPSITQRLNGLAEKSEVTTKTEQPFFPEN